MKSNLLVDNEQEVIEELIIFKNAGGGALCDISPRSVRVNPHSLVTISQQTGLHVVAGTSFYVNALQSEVSRMMTVREKAEVFVHEICEGIGDSGVRCGVIGEVGCSWPLTDSERRSLQAAALAQRQTGNTVHLYK